MRILIADDDPVARCRLEDCLQEWGYQVVAAADGAEAIQLLQAPDAPQLALLDWMMPGLDGQQVCWEMRRGGRDRYVYLILVTAKARTDEIVAAFEAGVDDYLRKPVDLLELRARLLAGQRIVQLQDDLIAAREAMRHQATHDALTGVWNRRAILDSLERELQRGKREGRLVCVIMADLDHFKRVNDTLGHQDGDAVLQEAVRRLEHDMRPYDLIGRYGGEEFVIVVPVASEDDAVHFADRLRVRIASEAFIAAGTALAVTVSLGVAHTGMANLAGSAELLHAADAALYKAKAGGRNRVVVYTSGMTVKEPRAPHLSDRALRSLS